MKLDAKQDTTLKLVRHYAAPVSRVFEAWTRPEILSQWFTPSADVSCDVTADVHVGGRYRIAMKAASGAEHIAVGTYEKIVPDRRLVFSWSWEQDPALASNTLVTITFEAKDGGTEMVLIHERLAGVEQRDKHSEGWTGCLNRLGQALE